MAYRPLAFIVEDDPDSFMRLLRNLLHVPVTDLDGARRRKLLNILPTGVALGALLALLVTACLGIAGLESQGMIDRRDAEARGGGAVDRQAVGGVDGWRDRVGERGGARVHVHRYPPPWCRCRD